MLNTPGYRINTPGVVHQTIDGETVILNLETGAYYSLRGVGAELWTFADQRLPVEKAVEFLGARYDADLETIAGATRALFDELKAESLIVPEAEPASADLVAPSGQKQPFEPPVLEKFAEMTDMLLLDPIHEVDERGWPHALPQEK